MTAKLNDWDGLGFPHWLRQPMWRFHLMIALRRLDEGHINRGIRERFARPSAPKRADAPAELGTWVPDEEDDDVSSFRIGGGDDAIA